MGSESHLSDVRAILSRSVSAHVNSSDWVGGDELEPWQHFFLLFSLEMAAERKRRLPDQIAGGHVDGDNDNDNEEVDASTSELEHNDETPADKRLRLAKEYLERTGGVSARKTDGTAPPRSVKRSAAGICGGSSTLPNVLGGHRLPVTAIALSPRCKRVLSAGKDGRALLHYLDGNCREKLAPLQPSDGKRHRLAKVECSRKYICAAASDDGNMFAAGDDGGLVTVWDAREKRPVAELSGHKGPVTGVAFRSRSQALLSCSDDRTIRVWSCDSLVHIDTLFGHQSGAIAVDALASDRAASAGRDRTVRAWRTESDKQLIFRSAAACPESACFVGPPGGSHILSGNEDGSVSLWSTSRRKPVQVRPHAHAPHHGVALETSTSRCKPLGRRAVREGERARRAVDAPSRNGDGAAAMAWVCAAAGDPGTDVAATGAGDGVVRLWRWRGSQLACAGAAPARGFVNDLDISAENGVLVAASGREPRMGRWAFDSQAHNGVLVHSINEPSPEDDDNVDEEEEENDESDDDDGSSGDSSEDNEDPSSDEDEQND